MGNNTSNYDIIDMNDQPLSPPYHRKGKAYGLILDRKLLSLVNSEWSFFSIYDLRNGKLTWRLYIKVYGDELELQLYLIRKKDGKDDLYFFFPLRWSSLSNNYMTVFKGYKEGKSIYLELYGDNIHSQRLANLKLENVFSIYGFIRFDTQDKIQIAF